MIVDSGPFLISPWQSLHLGVPVLVFESRECCRVSVLTSGLVTFEGGGGCVALESSRSAGGDGSVGFVIEEEGDEGSKGWETLLRFSVSRV